MSYILCLICCLFSFLSGVLFAMIKGLTVGKKQQEELTDEEILEQKKTKKEYEDFLKFDGFSSSD